VSRSMRTQTHEEHYQAAQSTGQDEGQTNSSKESYRDVILGSAVTSKPLYVDIITPAIHYCMGSIVADVDSAVIRKDGKAIPLERGRPAEQAAAEGLEDAGREEAVRTCRRPTAMEVWRPLTPW